MCGIANYSLTYLSIDLYPFTRAAKLLAHALVRRPVLRPVPLAAVHRHLALPAADERSSLARREVAGPSQLVAEALVLEHVHCGVVLAAIQRDPTAWTFVKGLDLRIHPARRVLTLSDCSLSILRSFAEVGSMFLESEHDTRQRGKRGIKTSDKALAGSDIHTF